MGIGQLGFWDDQLISPGSAPPCTPSDPRGYRKAGIDLKQMRRRLTDLSVTSEMSKSGGETAVSYRMPGGSDAGSE
jgi:hypothetical protein